MRRYLAGQVGRPWDKVFADICRYLDKGSAVQDHVRDHLNDYVAVCVIVIGGELRHGDGYGIGRPIYAVSARRAAKREVRRVINSYPNPSVVRSK